MKCSRAAPRSRSACMHACKLYVCADMSDWLRRAWLSGMRPGRPLRALLDQYSPHVFRGIVPPRPTDPEQAQHTLAELEASLRPLLLPNGRAADVAAWSESPHFVAWLRRAWILSAHCVPAAAQELRELPVSVELERLAHAAAGGVDRADGDEGRGLCKEGGRYSL